MEPTVTISISRYNELLKNENALKSNKSIIYIQSHDGYCDGRIITDNEAIEEIMDEIKWVVGDYWDNLSEFTSQDPSDKNREDVFKRLIRQE